MASTITNGLAIRGGHASWPAAMQSFLDGCVGWVSSSLRHAKRKHSLASRSCTNDVHPANRVHLSAHCSSVLRCSGQWLTGTVHEVKLATPREGKQVYGRYALTTFSMHWSMSKKPRETWFRGTSRQSANMQTPATCHELEWRVPIALI
jgi:hypothetical protein